MKYPVQITEKPLLYSIARSSDPNALVGASHLFKEGLALANQLESANNSDAPAGSEPPSPNPASSPSQPPQDCDEFLEDFTTVQSASGLKTPQSSKTTLVQSGSDRSWTQVWLQRGLLKLNQENFKGALENFRRVLQKDANSVEAMNALAVAQYRLANFQDAVASLHAAILLRPTQSTLYSNLGAVLYGSRDFAGAVSSFQKAARLDPKDAFAYYGMGLSLIQQRDYHKAIAAFQRAIAIDDRDAHSYYGLGYVHCQLGDLPAAIAAIGKAKQRNPQYAKRYETFLKHCLAQDDTPYDVR
ncbi:tetratricopeptide repeat protein [Altericista sp. CCNU0014]|uniref:tetratricopeptide repeat protein n=1 Tax=Altericista sp. CCNU0014 TaxID=3082949 RepID=UPI00385071D8